MNVIKSNFIILKQYIFINIDQLRNNNWMSVTFDRFIRTMTGFNAFNKQSRYEIIF